MRKLTAPVLKRRRIDPTDRRHIRNFAQDLYALLRAAKHESGGSRALPIIARGTPLRAWARVDDSLAAEASEGHDSGTGSPTEPHALQRRSPA
jgi:hypothetical protein